MPASFAILVGSLDPSPELASVVELLAWARRARPDLAPLVIARAGGAWADRIGALADLSRLDEDPRWGAARLVQRVGAEPIARPLRVAATRRAMRVGAVPVVVEASGEPLRAWIDPGAGPVLTHHHGIEPDDPTALVDVWPGSDRPGDADGIVAARRAELPTAGRWVAALSPAGHVLPDDRTVGLIWSSIEAHPGLRAAWVCPPLAATARSAVERHLGDCGLDGLTLVVDDGEDAWRTVAAADAVVAPGSHPMLALAAGRVVRLDRADPHATADELAGSVTDVVEAVPADGPDDPSVVVARAGPRWLAALGLDR